MTRHCRLCGRELVAFAVRCSCGAALPEARDLRSDPDNPTCGMCGAAISLMAETCPSCGARGYPGLRPRRSHKSLGAPEAGE
jgi:ribosomal protein L40E